MTKSGGIAGILPTTEKSHALARMLARRLGAILLESPPAEGLYLACNAEGLWLRLRTARRELAIRAEFSTGQQAYRAGRASLRGEAIARACGLPRHGSRQVVDATAGLGRDAHVLARLGARVTLIERSPVIFALLEDAFDRAVRTQPLSGLGRMRLIEGDATVWLQTCAPQERPAVIYLDPMYPRQAKRATPGKEMQVLQTLLGAANEDTDSLLQAARRTALDRVVVKRPQHAEPLVGHQPHYQIAGRSTRFDVYLATPR